MGRATRQQVDAWLTLAGHCEAPVAEIVQGFVGLAAEVEALRAVERQFTKVTAKMLIYLQCLETQAQLEALQKVNGALDDSNSSDYAAPLEAVKRVPDSCRNSRTL